MIDVFIPDCSDGFTGAPTGQNISHYSNIYIYMRADFCMSIIP